MTRREQLAKLLEASRRRRRKTGEHVCLACGRDTYSALRSRCPPCVRARGLAQSKARDRTRAAAGDTRTQRRHDADGDLFV